MASIKNLVHIALEGKSYSNDRSSYLIYGTKNDIYKSVLTINNNSKQGYGYSFSLDIKHKDLEKEINIFNLYICDRIWEIEHHIYDYLIQLKSSLKAFYESNIIDAFLHNILKGYRINLEKFILIKRKQEV